MSVALWRRLLQWNSPSSPSRLFSRNVDIANDKVWTKKDLANLPSNDQSTAQTLLRNVSHRLREQQRRLNVIQTNHSGIIPGAICNHLLYIHRDTEKLVRELVEEAPVVFERWNAADQTLVKKTFQQVRDRHATAMERFVDFVEKTSETIASNKAFSQHDALESKFQDIFQSRIGILLLCDHYVKLQKEQKEGVSGAILTDCPIMKEIVPDAVAEASHVCEAHWMVAPSIRIEDETMGQKLTVVGPWLNAVLVETLKNAMQATMSVVSTEDDPNLIPEVLVNSYLSDVHQKPTMLIDVIDRGSGLPKHTSPEDLFRWSRIRHDQRWDRLQDQQSYAAVRSPLAGLGVGLASSRAMLRHFGGNLDLAMNKEAHGTTAST